MKLLPILFAVLLILPVAFPLQPVPVFPTPVASAIFDDFSGFLSGIAHWLGFAPANAKEGCLIEAVASPSEGGRADGSGAYACSTTVRLSAYPAFGYELVNFTAQGCQLVAATGQNAVVTTGSFGSCRITAIFDKPSAKNAQLPKKESVTVTEIPASIPPATPVPERCPKVTQEVECGEQMTQTSPLFVGSDGCPRKCRTTAKCTGTDPIQVECSTIATVSSWTEGGCTYVCSNAIAGATPSAPAQEQPATNTNENNGSAGTGTSGGSTTGGSSGTDTSGTGGTSNGSSGTTSGGTPAPTPSPTPAPTPNPTPTPNPSPTPSLPDYTIQVVAGGPTCTVNKMIPGPFLVLVTNIGTATGPSFTYQTWFNSAAPVSHTHAGLSAGEQQLVANLQPVCQSGSNTYNAVVDPNNQVTELNEGNNAGSATITGTG